MVQIPSKPLTLAAFLELPETEPPSEYIDGAIVQKNMPQGKHSILQRELTFVLTATFRETMKAQVFPKLRCTFGGRSLVPDISVFETSRIPRDSNGDVANPFDLHPDWTIEILSPNQSHSRVVRNILHCLNYGTEMGWLLDPQESCIFVYGSDRRIQVWDDGESMLPVPELAREVRPSAREILSWLKK